MSKMIDAEGALILPKRVSAWSAAGVIAGGLYYGVTVGMAASDLRAQVARLEQNDVRVDRERAENRAALDRRLTRVEADRDRIVTLETQIKIVIETLNRIDQKLDRRP